MKNLGVFLLTGLFSITSFADSGSALSMRGKDQLRPASITLSIHDVDPLLGGVDFRNKQAGYPYLESFRASRLVQNAFYFLEDMPKTNEQWSYALSASFALSAIGKILDYEAIHLKLVSTSSQEWVDAVATQILSNVARSDEFLNYWKAQHANQKTIPRHTVYNVYEFLKAKVAQGYFEDTVVPDSHLGPVTFRWQFRFDHNSDVSFQEQRTLPETLAGLKETIEAQLVDVRRVIRRRAANTLLFRKYNDLLNPYSNRYYQGSYAEQLQRLNPMSEVTMVSQQDLEKAYQAHLEDIVMHVTRPFQVGQVQVTGSKTCKSQFFGLFQKHYSALRVELYQQIQKDFEVGKINDAEVVERIKLARNQSTMRALDQARDALAETECRDVKTFVGSFIETYDSYQDVMPRKSGVEKIRQQFVTARHLSLVQTHGINGATPFFETVHEDKQGHLYFIYLMDESEAKSEKVALTWNRSGSSQFSPEYLLMKKLRIKVIEKRLEDRMRITLRTVAYQRYQVFVDSTPFAYEGVEGIRLSTTLSKPRVLVDQLFKSTAFSIENAYEIP